MLSVGVLSQRRPKVLAVDQMAAEPRLALAPSS